MKFCVKCGNALEDSNTICPQCGKRVVQAASSASSNGAAASGGVVTPSQLKVPPVVAALLSVLLVGLGQMLNGQVPKGLAMLGASLAIGLILTLTVVGVVLVPAVWVVSAIDAYRCAKKLESGLCIGKWSFF